MTDLRPGHQGETGDTSGMAPNESAPNSTPNPKSRSEKPN
ncbi:hypothetical protein HMPREF9278_0708 [Mobiluncus mulieris FB024-16]|nr:hypothetical protein HMPREF9278_0708 [Mobiluncus mulieris FB024-16]